MCDSWPRRAAAIRSMLVLDTLIGLQPVRGIAAEQRMVGGPAVVPQSLPPIAPPTPAHSGQTQLKAVTYTTGSVLGVLRSVCAVTGQRTAAVPEPGR